MRTLSILLLVFIILPGVAQVKEDSLLLEIQQAEHDSNRVDLLRVLAWDFFRSDLEKGRQYLLQAYDLCEEHGFFLRKANCIYNFAVLSRLEGNYEKSIALSHEALDMFSTANKEALKAGPYFNLGAIYRTQGKLEEAAKNLLAYLKIAEQSGNQYNIANALNSLANTNNELRYYDKAGRDYRRAAQVFAEIGEQNHQAMVYSNLSSLFATTEQFDSAEVYADRSFDIYQITGYATGQCRALTALIEINLGKGLFEKAFTLVLELLEVASNTQRPDDLVDAKILQATVLSKMNRWSEARDIALEALPQAETIGQIADLQNIYQLLAEADEKSGEFQRALAMQKQYYLYRDSVLNEDRIAIVKDLEAKYENSKQEQQLQAQALEISQTKDQRNVFILAALLLSLLAIAIWLIWRTRLRYREQLNAREISLREAELTRVQQEKKLELLKAVYQTQEKERNRIARELHDGMGSLMASIKGHFNSAISNGKTNAETIKKTNQLIDQAGSDVRRMAHNMMPSALLKFGLVDALKDTVNTLRVHHQLETELEIIDLKDQLDSETELMIYRITQELTNNILKYAGANRAFIQLSQSDEYLTLIVEDNGKGFDLAAPEHQQGLGLSSVRSRVEMLNGDLDILSELGEGTTVTVQVPVH